jgi:6-pyruvoyltetrahydropterin/6-carboxytetrahydropterin synthase
MYTLKTNSSFDSAHFLSGYQGKCSNIHGHRWVVEVEIGGETLEKSGSKREMLVDFGDFKDDLKTITDDLDHSLLIEKDSLKSKTMEALMEENFRVIELPFRPTAENFARYFYEQIENKGYRVVRTTVYETPNNCASYSDSNSDSNSNSDSDSDYSDLLFRGL